MRKIINLLLEKKTILFVLIAILSIAFSLKVGKVEMREDEETFISPTDSILKQYRDFQQSFESDEGVIVAYESSNIFSIDEINYLNELHSKLEQLSGVDEVNSLMNCENITGTDNGITISPIINIESLTELDLAKASLMVQNNPLIEDVYLSKDQKVVALIINLPGMFNGGSDSIQKQFFDELTNLIIKEEIKNKRIIHIGGDIVTDASIEKLMDKDLSLLFPLSLIFCTIILFFFYRTLITTLVPLVPVLLAIVWVIGLKGWTNIPMTPISITLFPLIMVIGLANSVHIISHYQKLRSSYRNNKEAVKATLHAVLKPCFSAAITTAAGFGSLAVSNVTGIKQMGIFAAFGVIAAFLLSIIIIPAALLKTKNFGKENKVIKRKNFLYPVLIRVNQFNQFHTRKVALVFAAITVIAAFYIPQIKVEGSMASFAKEKTKLRSDIRYIDEHLSGITSFELVLDGEEGVFKDPEILANLVSIEASLCNNENVLKVFGLTNMVKTINKALHNDDDAFSIIPDNETEIAQYLFLYEISGGDELSSFVNDSYSKTRMTIRTKQMSNIDQNAFIEDLNLLASSKLNGISRNITGFGKLMNHINDNLITTQIESILMALGIIMVMMFVLFGIRGGLYSILPNVFPILFFLGLMGMFGIDLNMATSIIAAVTIGIVVDDTIHVFYGFKKEMQTGSTPSISIKNTLLKTGAALCTTSLILTLGFGVLTFSNSKFIADFGLMSASAIAAALLGDLFISPIVLLKTKLFYKKPII